MRNSKLLLSIIAGVGVLIGSEASSRAEDFSLHLEPTLVMPLNDPQGSTYTMGFGMAAKGMFNLNRNWAVGPSLSTIYLPRDNDNGQNAGVLWQAGGSVRLQGDRTRHFDGANGWSPWVDVDLMAAHTGALVLPAFDVGAGMEVALDQENSAWMGPFVRYTHVFQLADTQDGMSLNKSDINMLQVGASFSFDFPPHRRTEYVTVHDRQVVVKHDTVVVVQKATPEKFSLTEKVYFDRDSASLRWESADKLNAIVAKLNQHKNVNVKVEGHASQDHAKMTVAQLNYNLGLSLARTGVVVKYLVNHGVDASRLHGSNFGVDKPAVPYNGSKENMERSRRVEFEVVFSSVE